MPESPVIAHLIATNFYGGPERQIVAHARRLLDGGYRPHIVSFDEGRPNELARQAERQGLPAHLLRSRGSFNPLLVFELAAFIKRRGVRLLCAHGYKSNVVGRLAAWLAGVPFIAVSRGWTAECPRIRLYEKLDRLFLKFADHVVAVSEGQRQKVLAAGVGWEKVSVIRNSIDADAPAGAGNPGLRRELGIPPEGVLVATAGRLSPEKNHLGLIEAARLARVQNPHLYFCVFGEGFLRPQLERAVREAGLAEAFFLPGFRRDLPQVLCAVDIFTLPSFTEGLPNVILEAFVCERPVVATDVGGTPEVVDHGVNGFLVPAGDSRALAEKILALAADPGLRARMGRSGHGKVRREFGFGRQAARYLFLYEAVLQGRPDG